MKYTENYNFRKPEDIDPVDIQDLNYNADAIDGKLKEIEDWEAAHLQASNPHSITPALIGAETPTGAQAKVDAHEQKAAPHSGHETPAGAQEKANAAASAALTNANNYTDTSVTNALNEAKNHANNVSAAALASANNYTDQTASNLNQKIDETRIKILDVQQDLSNLSRALTNLNPNQEAKQSVSGYGILSLPKNAAEVQISGVVKGNTITNLLGDLGAAIKKIGRSDATEAKYPLNNLKPLTEYTLIFNVSDVVVGNGGRIIVSLTSGDDATKTFPNTVGIKKYKFTTPSNFDNTKQLWVYFTTADYNEGARANISNVMIVEGDWTTRSINDIEYISGTKSTLSGVVKSVGKNIWGGRKAAEDIVRIINNPQVAYLTTVDGRNVLALVGDSALDSKLLFSKFKPNTQYVIKVEGRRADDTGTGGILSIKYTDGTKMYLINHTSSWVKMKITTVQGKTVQGLYTELSTGQKIYYFDYDTLQIEEGATETPYEPYKETVAYLPNVVLRSLPNGVKDEFNVVEGKYTKKVSDTVSVSGTMFAALDTTTYVNVDVVKTTAFSDAVASTTSKDGMTRLYDKNGAELSEVAQTDIDNAASVGKYYRHTNKALWIIVAKGAYADIAAARTGLGTMTLNYQLANPDVRNVPAQILTGGPNHTIMWLPEVPDAGVYNNGISILIQDLPIKGLKKLSKIDFYTGEEIELDITKAVIAADKKSFTHPGLTNDDIAFFVYEYPLELSTLPEMVVEYYDSRYVVQDTQNGKMYTWKIVSTNGVASIQLTEVV